MSDDEMIKIAREQRAVEYGRLCQSVDTLAKKVNELSDSFNLLSTHFDALNDKYRTGRGIAIGLFFAASTLGGVVGNFVHKFIEIIK